MWIKNSKFSWMQIQLVMNTIIVSSINNNNNNNIYKWRIILQNYSSCNHPIREDKLIYLKECNPVATIQL